MLIHKSHYLFLSDTAYNGEYTSLTDKITFIVQTVYTENGESIQDILLKLIMEEVESAYLLSLTDLTLVVTFCICRKD